MKASIVFEETDEGVCIRLEHEYTLQGTDEIPPVLQVAYTWLHIIVQDMQGVARAVH